MVMLQALLLESIARFPRSETAFENFFLKLGTKFAKPRENCVKVPLCGRLQLGKWYEYTFLNTMRSNSELKWSKNRLQEFSYYIVSFYHANHVQFVGTSSTKTAQCVGTFSQLFSYSTSLGGMLLRALLYFFLLEYLFSSGGGLVLQCSAYQQEYVLLWCCVLLEYY